MTRNDMSTLHNIPLFLREATAKDGDARPGRDMVLCRASDRGTVLAFFNRDDIFDKNGNHFANN